MRLINVDTLELEYFIGEHGRSIPTYAILSHVWTTEEVSFQQMTGLSPLPEESKGYRKIADFCAKAKAEGFGYAWVDTCCIDKTSSAELSEAINSMFQWYRKSAACYVYLDDVTCAENPRLPDSKFRHSRWFTRGWTLQELLAPHEVIFLADDWREIGTKASLNATISDITKIDTITLVKHTWSHVSVAGIMSWASMRRTTRLEDQAYSLLGLFDVNMPLIYGEGPKAFYRLQVEIMKTTNDDSLFAWSTEPLDTHGYSTSEGASTRGFRFLGLLAPSPACFSDSHDIRAPKDIPGRHAPYDMVKQDISLSAVLVRLCSLPNDPKQLGDIDRVDVVGTLRFSKNVKPVKAVDHGLVITAARQDAKGIKIMCLVAVLRCWNKDGYIGIPIKSLASGGYQRVENGNRCRWFRIRLMPLRLSLKSEDERADDESEYRLRQFDSESRDKGPPADPPETVLVRAYVPLDLPSDNTPSSLNRTSTLQFRSLPINDNYYKICTDHPQDCIPPLAELDAHAKAIERINNMTDTQSTLYTIFHQRHSDMDLPPFIIRIERSQSSQETKVGYLLGLEVESWNDATNTSDAEFVNIDMQSPSTTIHLTEDVCLVFRIRHGTPWDKNRYVNVSIEKFLPWTAEEENLPVMINARVLSSSDMALARSFTDNSI